MEEAESPKENKLPSELRYIQYEHSLEKKYLPSISALISKDLSEPYSIYVYRYFLYQWGHLCYLVSIFDPWQDRPLPDCLMRLRATGELTDLLFTRRRWILPIRL